MSTLIINFFDVKIELSSSTTAKTEDIKLRNIALRKIGMNKINIIEVLLKNGINLKKCNSCDAYANFQYIFNVIHNENENIINFTDITYPKYKNLEKLYCGKCLSHLNTNSIERVSKLYNVSTDEANKIILERNKSCFYSTNFTNKEDYKLSQSRGKQWYINRYGEIDGCKRFEKNIKKFVEASNAVSYKKDSMSLNFFLKKYEDENIAKIEYNKRKQGNRATLEKSISKYGYELGTERYNKKIEHLAYCNSLSYYIEKYGNEEGKTKYELRSKKLACNLENFIKRYGDKGEEKYKLWLSKITLNGKFYSKESKLFFDKLKNKLNVDIVYGDKEWFIYDKLGYKNQHIFFYDAYIKQFNLLIEYDTPAFHPNPTYLTLEEISKFTRWGDNEKDIYKENLAKLNGYKFYRVFIKTKKQRDIELSKLIDYMNSL
jgi:hypothetical protein